MLPARIFFLILITLAYVIPLWLGKKNLAQRFRDALNCTDPEYLRKEAPRCYIYSKSDTMILDRDVEEHADEAEAKGMHIVKERFVGTPHVGHMRGDGARYWGIVGKTWDMRA